MRESNSTLGLYDLIMIRFKIRLKRKLSLGRRPISAEKAENGDSLRHCFDHFSQVGPQVKSVKSLR